VVIAALDQFARPLERFMFGAEIFCPCHPFAAPSTARCCQAVVIGDPISHLFPYGVDRRSGSAKYPEIEGFRTDVLKLSLSELIN